MRGDVHRRCTLNGLVFVAGPALLEYPDLGQQSPELALLVIACNYALPMAAWMRFRGMAWRPTLEMSGATIGLGIAMIGPDRLDVVQQSSLRGWVLGFCGPACVVMVVVMLFRLGLYTGGPAGAHSSSGLPIDPVCRMAVDPWHGAGRLTHEGVEYCFCSLGCAGAFAQHPSRYTANDR